MYVYFIVECTCIGAGTLRSTTRKSRGMSVWPESRRGRSSQSRARQRSRNMGMKYADSRHLTLKPALLGFCGKSSSKLESQLCQFLFASGIQCLKLCWLNLNLSMLKPKRDLGREIQQNPIYVCCCQILVVDLRQPRPHAILLHIHSMMGPQRKSCPFTLGTFKVCRSEGGSKKLLLNQVHWMWPKHASLGSLYVYIFIYIKWWWNSSLP